jgi:hypothetical protein
VLCEVLSDPALPPSLAEDVANLPLLNIGEDYWLRRPVAFVCAEVGSQSEDR